MNYLESASMIKSETQSGSEKTSSYFWQELVSILQNVSLKNIVCESTHAQHESKSEENPESGSWGRMDWRLIP